MIRRLVLAAIAILVLSQIPASAWIAQVPAAVGGGPFTLIAHTAASSTDTNNVTTSGIDTSGCTAHCLIVCSVQAFPGGTVPTACGDNKGNTYTAIAAEVGTGTWHRFWYKADAAVGTGHTFSTSGGAGGDVPSIGVVVFNDSNGTTAALDAGIGVGAHSDVSVTTLANGSFTPANNNEVLVSGLQFASTGTVSIDSGLTITDKLNVVASTAEGVAVAYLIQGTAAAVNATWTFPSSTAATQLIGFKP